MVTTYLPELRNAIEICIHRYSDFAGCRDAKFICSCRLVVPSLFTMMIDFHMLSVNA